MIQRRQIDNSIEHKIITGLITSDQFANRMLPMLQPNYFSTDYAAQIYEWCKEYFNAYKTVPQKQIQEIYNSNRELMDEEKQKLIESFLVSISEKYSQAPDYNMEYFIDQAMVDIKKHALKNLADKAIKYLASGRVDKAEDVVQDYKKVAKATAVWANPFDPKFIKETLQSDEDGDDQIFKFKGALGELTGWHERSWLVAVLAPMKVGKTFVLIDIAIECIKNRKKVAFFSLEMAKKRMEKRILKSVTAFGKIDGDVIYPCFDCRSNQNNSCPKSARINRVRLLDAENKKPKYSDSNTYTPCTLCRGKDKELYKVATWFCKLKRPASTTPRVLAKAKQMLAMFGDNFRIISYPANSANTANIKNDLNTLEYTEDFVPDVIIIDYADILKPEDSRIVDPRAKADSTWLMLKNLADSRHCLVVTASQGTRKSIGKSKIGQVDIAEDIRKLAHIDRMYGLSQTEIEKLAGVLKINVVGDRDKDFHQGNTVILLQQRDVGQVSVDSELSDHSVMTEEEKMGKVCGED